MMWRKRKEEALHYKQQSTYARLYKTFYTTILLERIGGGITILKRGVIITFGCVYILNTICIMSAVGSGSFLVVDTSTDTAKILYKRAV